MTDQPTLKERLRLPTHKIALWKMLPWMIEAADALDARDVLLVEAEKALEPFVELLATEDKKIPLPGVVTLLKQSIPEEWMTYASSILTKIKVSRSPTP